MKNPIDQSHHGPKNRSENFGSAKLDRLRDVETSIKTSVEVHFFLSFLHLFLSAIFMSLIIPFVLFTQHTS